MRRQTKLNSRKHVAQHPPAHMAGPGGPGIPPGVPSSNPMATPVPRQQPSNMGMGGPQLHHHHAHPDGSVSGGTDDVSGMFHQM